MIGGVLICNVALLAAVVALVGLPKWDGLRAAIILWSLFPVGLAAILAKDRPVVIGCLLWLIALYPLSAVLSG